MRSPYLGLCHCVLSIDICHNCFVFFAAVCYPPNVSYHYSLYHLWYQSAVLQLASSAVYPSVHPHPGCRYHTHTHTHTAGLKCLPLHFVNEIKWLKVEFRFLRPWTLFFFICFNLYEWCHFLFLQLLLLRVRDH